MPAAVGHKAFIEVPNTDSEDVTQTSFVLYRLLMTSTRPYQWNVTANMPSQDATGFAATAPIVRTQRSDGLGDWNATATAYFPKTSPASGHLGNVIFANGFDTCVDQWTADFQYEVFDATCMNSVAPSWREMQVGLASATGTYRCKVPANDVPTLVGQSGSATLQLSTAVPNNTIIATIHITAANIVAQIGELVTVDYSFTFEGQATFAGGVGGASSLITAGTLTEPEETEIAIWTVNDEQGYSGRCFLSGFTANVAIGSPVEIGLSIQGTNALTLVTS